MKHPNYSAFAREAAKLLRKDDVFTDYLRCYAYGTEASCYRYVPKVVAIARSEADVAALFALARRYRTPLCFRAAGSSLSGQSSCESVLVVMKWAFDDLACSQGGFSASGEKIALDDLHGLSTGDFSLQPQKSAPDSGAKLSSDAKRSSTGHAAASVQTRSGKMTDFSQEAEESPTNPAENENWVHQHQASYRDANLAERSRALDTQSAERAPTSAEVGNSAKVARDSEQNATVLVGAGVLGQAVNDYLAPLGRKMGPDPATISTALVGGILSNNSSGMCCGTADNSYQTLASIRVILPDGTLLDTSDSASIARFRRSHAALLAELAAMREQILADAELCALIRRKFAIKNTTGYSLNAFIDFADPIDILAHLFIGAEGTLGAIISAQLRTIAIAAHTACALLFYERIDTAAQAISAFAERDFLASAEIMDYACLRTASAYAEVARLLEGIAPGTTAVLVQAEAASAEELERKIALIKQLGRADKMLLSAEEAEYSLWWKIRKALLPIAASTRREGSTVITEDLCFKVSELAQGIAQTQALFEEFGFANNGIIFGHALAGNIHFIITPLLSDAREAANFAALVEKMARVVAGYEGSIKAEHGTGRMVAPFVELEWGERAYALNRRIKQLFDPHGLCNPDVIITNDAQIYKKRIKSAPPVDERLAACMECGMCERFCPSAARSLSPRQRIAVLREMARLEAAAAGDNSLLEGAELSAAEAKSALAQIRRGYEYFVNATCAACSMCAQGCPLGIDVAAFTADYRRRKEGAIARALKLAANGAHASTLAAARGVLRLANALGAERCDALAQRLNMRAFSTMPRANTGGNAAAVAAAEQVAAAAAAGAQNVASTGGAKSANGCTGGAETGASERMAAAGQSADRPNTASDRPNTTSDRPANLRKIIYFGSCLNRAMAPSARMADPRPLAAVAASLARKAGVEFELTSEAFCCGKAYDDSAAVLARNEQRLSEWLAAQDAAVVLDHSACSGKMFAQFGREFKGCSGQSYPIWDLVEFCEQILPLLRVRQSSENIGLYLMCSARKNGLGGALRAVAAACTTGEVVEDAATFCCGFAGYKGFLTPALNAGAVGKFKRFYSRAGLARGFSSSSTCEIGLADATQMSWQHIAYLLDEVSE